MSRYQPPAYQPPRPYQPPQPQQPSYPYPPQHVVHHYQSPPKTTAVAVLLEVLPGLCLQTFGIGHMYSGNVGVGLLFMFGYWFVQFINILLCFVLIGFITGPLCFVLALVISPILASNAAERANAAAGYRNPGYR